MLLGPNHQDAGRQPAGASEWRAGAFVTPLGEVLVDEAFASALSEVCPLVVAPDPAAHGEDHALEVQLPFLLVRASPRRPAIVPIRLRWDVRPHCEKLAVAIVTVARERGPENVRLLTSSDMTHFEPANEALRHDEPSLAAIRRLDSERLLRVCRERKISMVAARRQQWREAWARVPRTLSPTPPAASRAAMT